MFGKKPKAQEQAPEQENTQEVEQERTTQQETREQTDNEQQTEQIEPTAPTKKKKGLLGKFKKQEEEYIPPVDTKVYLFTEVNKMGIVHYLRNNNIEVAIMGSDPGSMLGAVLIEDYRSRLVVLDYGRGKFIDPEYVESIIGLIEVFSDIGYITIFTNSTLMQNAIKYRFNKNKNILAKIDTYKYKGAVDVYSRLKQYNETYTISGATDIRPENTMEFKGTLVANTEKPQYDRLKFKEPHLINEEDKEDEGILAYMD